MKPLSEGYSKIDQFGEVERVEFDSPDTFETEKEWILPTLEKSLAYKIFVGRTDLFGKDDVHDPRNPKEYKTAEMLEILQNDPDLEKSPYRQEILDKYEYVEEKGGSGMNVINPHTASKITTLVTTMKELLSLEHGNFANTTWGEEVTNNMRKTIVGLMEYVQHAKETRTPMKIEMIEMAYDMAESVFRRLSPENTVE